MRTVLLISLLFVSAFQAVMGEVEGDWEYYESGGSVGTAKYLGMGVAVHNRSPQEITNITRST